MIRNNPKRKIRKTKNPREESKLQKSLNKFIDKKLDLYVDYNAVGIIDFLENERKAIKKLDDDDIHMLLTNGLSHIAILCKEMFDLIKKEE